MSGWRPVYTIYRRLLIRGLSRAHRAVYRASGGRMLGSLVGMPVLLLTTTGRRSGMRRTTPLTFLRDGTDLVVVASNGGANRPPDWWLNLQHNSRAVVQIGQDRASVTARTASAQERERLWPLITTTYAGYAKYQQKTTRKIPVVLLTADLAAGPPGSSPGTIAVGPKANGTTPIELGAVFHTRYSIRAAEWCLFVRAIGEPPDARMRSRSEDVLAYRRSADVASANRNFAGGYGVHDRRGGSSRQ